MEAFSRRWAAFSMADSALGISVLSFPSCEELTVSLPTLTRLSTALETALTGRSRSGIALPSSPSSCRMISLDT